MLRRELKLVSQFLGKQAHHHLVLYKKLRFTRKGQLSQRGFFFFLKSKFVRVS